MKAHGPEHPGVATPLGLLAIVYQETNRATEAEPLYQRVLSMIEKALPVDDPSQVAIRENYADLLENYAELLEQLGRGEEAAELRARIEAIRWRQEPPLSPS